MAFGKFGKYYPGGIDFLPENLDLHAVLRQEVDEFCLAAGAGDRLVFRAVTGAVAVRSDRKHLKYIVVNLLQNALKYSSPGSEVRISLAADEGQAVISVANQGIGIPQAELEELFSPFYRASNVGDLPGTGMGLAIVNKSARLIGAEIEVESVQGKGTRFQVSLPR